MRVFKELLGLLLPVPCVCCGLGHHPCCPSCLPVASPFQFSRGSTQGVAASPYTANLAKLFKAYKETGYTSLAKDLAPVASASIALAVQQFKPDLITYLPSTRASYRKRGFNPAAAVLREALRRSNGGPQLPRSAATMTFIRGVQDQAGLDAKARYQNLKGALSAKAPTGSRVLIFDDVVTTGATLQAAEAALAQSGATVVGFCALAETFLNSAKTSRAEA